MQESCTHREKKREEESKQATHDDSIYQRERAHLVDFSRPWRLNVLCIPNRRS